MAEARVAQLDLSKEAEPAIGDLEHQHAVAGAELPVEASNDHDDGVPLVFVGDDLVKHAMEEMDTVRREVLYGLYVGSQLPFDGVDGVAVDPQVGRVEADRVVAEGCAPG